MKRIACFLVVPFLLAACGKGTASATPKPNEEDDLLVKKTDPGRELTREGYVKCNPEKFIPFPTEFKAIEGSQTHTYTVEPSSEFNGKASLTVWGVKTECIDNVHKLAYYGQYEPSIITQISENNDIRYFVQKDDAIYLVGANKSGKMPLCSGIENCSNKVFKDAQGKLMITLSNNDVILVNEEILVASEPKLLPVIGGKK